MLTRLDAYFLKADTVAAISILLTRAVEIRLIGNVAGVLIDRRETRIVATISMVTPLASGTLLRGNTVHTSGFKFKRLVSATLIIGHKSWRRLTTHVLASALDAMLVVAAILVRTALSSLDLNSLSVIGILRSFHIGRTMAKPRATIRADTPFRGMTVLGTIAATAARRHSVHVTGRWSFITGSKERDRKR